MAGIMKILKGSQLAPMPLAADVISFFDTGAKLARIQFVVPVEQTSSHKEWEPWIFQHADYVKSTLSPIASNYGAKLIIDFHTPFKGIFNKAGTAVGRTWKEVALKFKNDWNVWAYSILNEPRTGAIACRNLMTTCYEMIRSVDKRKWVFITSPYGNPEKSFGLDYFKSYKDKKLAVTANMYDVLNFTHYGINNTDPNNAQWPNFIGHREWDRDRMIKVLRKLRTIQTKRKIPVYIGEFGASKFLGETYRLQWFQDLIGIFNEYGWCWTAHAWREASVWDLEDGKVGELFIAQWT